MKWSPRFLAVPVFCLSILLAAASGFPAAPKPTSGSASRTDTPAAQDTAPFGAFDTPMEGSTRAGVIPVTGWALDDNDGITVSIYQVDGDQQIFLDQARFVEGARPDVALAFPGYYGGGWTVMLNSYRLANGGNGSCTLLAQVTDVVGQIGGLETKTFVCDNAGSVKPFGNIDAPDLGGVAMGTQFMVQGWVLTPRPNQIPADGSTINVFVDGVVMGHPTYNVYRADIATLFPGFANSNGASAFFLLDTTPYADGLHTIQWTATDNAGNSDGIGSRYFLIQNGPEIEVQGRGLRIANSDTIPSAVDGTDFNDVPLEGAAASQEFIILNTGGSDLFLTGVAVEGEGFSVTHLTTTVVHSNQSTSFLVYFQPITQGPRGGLVRIFSNDANEGTTLFAVQGNGVPGTKVEDRPVGQAPLSCSLSQNHPNPFNSRTLIQYDPGRSCRVTLAVIDPSGRRVRTLVDAFEQKGEKTAVWDGSDGHGVRTASGLYFCRMLAGSQVKTVKMILLD
jgi:hypothetical protein